MHNLIKYVEEMSNPKRAEPFPFFKAGDTIDVYINIQEGNKSRIQHFQGVVLQRRNVNTNGETFTVRKISKEIAVEHIFSLHSPNIEKIEVKRRGRVRRARIYYLRGKKGKAARIKVLR